MRPRCFLPSPGCLIALALILTTLAGVGWEIWDSLKWDCTDVVLDRQPSPDGSLIAVVHETTYNTFFFDMTVIVATVHLVTAKPPSRDTSLLGIDTGGQRG